MKNATKKAAKKAAKKAPAKKAAAKRPTKKPVLLSGGNPQIAKAYGDAPVQTYIAAMPEWKYGATRKSRRCGKATASRWKLKSRQATAMRAAEMRPAKMRTARM